MKTTNQLRASQIRDSWYQYAACRGVANRDGTYNTFFPERGDNLFQVQEARDICEACPVRVRCLDFAINNNIRDGIWGGKTERQRRNIRRSRRKEMQTFLEQINGALDEVAFELIDV